MRIYSTSKPHVLPSGLAAGLLAAALLPGTISYAGQEKLAAKMAETCSEVLRTGNQLQTTMGALSKMKDGTVYKSTLN